jgi:hypothetical protein
MSEEIMRDPLVWKAWASGSPVTDWDVFMTATMTTVEGVVRENCIASLLKKLAVARAEQKIAAAQLEVLSAKCESLYVAVERVRETSDWARAYRQAIEACT